MNFEEKIKEKFLYKKGLNILKVTYLFYQFIKSKIKLKKSYSNWGVDMMADFFFRGQGKGIYIDVGCHHAFLNNNTYPLYKRGWNGINIDIDFNTIDSFNYFRRNDCNIQIAASHEKGNTDLFFYHNRAAKNTLSKTNGLNAKEIRTILTDTLNNIINNSKFKDHTIDFLSIDVEGFELNVLKGFDFKKYKPKLVVVEFIQPEVKEFFHQKIENIQNSELYTHMSNQDYKLINWIHDDLVFVPNDIRKS
jgi:FkbM family methyltransferase